MCTLERARHPSSLRLPLFARSHSLSFSRQDRLTAARPVTSSRPQKPEQTILQPPSAAPPSPIVYHATGSSPQSQKHPRQMGASISSGGSDFLSSFSHEPFVPTVEDAEESLNLLSQLIPPELAIVVLDEAQYWPREDNVSTRHVVVRAGPTGELKRASLIVSAPIRSGATTHSLRRVRITTDSRDQGFSSFPQHRGTREASSSWIEAALVRRQENSSTYSVVLRETLFYNLHAMSNYHSHTHELLAGESELVDSAQPDDRIAVYAAAQYPMWVNDVKSSKITVEYAAV